MVTGWEGFIVLTDIRGLSPTQARGAAAATAMTLIRAAVAETPIASTTRLRIKQLGPT